MRLAKRRFILNGLTSAVLKLHGQVSRSFRTKTFRKLQRPGFAKLLKIKKADGLRTKADFFPSTLPEYYRSVGAFCIHWSTRTNRKLLTSGTSIDSE